MSPHDIITDRIGSRVYAGAVAGWATWPSGMEREEREVLAAMDAAVSVFRLAADGPYRCGTYSSIEEATAKEDLGDVRLDADLPGWGKVYGGMQVVAVASGPRQGAYAVVQATARDLR